MLSYCESSITQVFQRIQDTWQRLNSAGPIARKLLSLCLLIPSLFVAQASAQPYTFTGSNWANGAADVYVDFDITNPQGSNPPNIASGGPSNTDFQTAYVNAMLAWNNTTVFQFFPNLSGSPVDPCNSTRNGVKFDTVSCSGAFGATTLAVQSTSFSVPSNESFHTVTVFNNTKTWDIYNGSLQAAEDFSRVAVHELGHGLGLDHSDAGNIMFASVSSAVEIPQAGDISGVSVLYGAGGGVDVDGDGISNSLDNCPVDANSAQTNSDGDTYGDACDLDVDGDGFVADLDNCPLDANPGQEDADGDLQGDVCDSDADGDGIFNGPTVDTSWQYDDGQIFGSLWRAGPNSNNSAFPFFAQTFQATNSGDLTRVQLPLNCPTGNATLQIRELSGSQPSSTILSSDIFVGGAGILPSSNQGFITLDIATPPSVSAGTSYAIVVEAESECALFSSGGYTNGVAYLGTTGGFWSNTSTDFRFQVWVDPQPTDNCPITVNPSQADSDMNGIGDACDIADQDGDGIEDSLDNCPMDANADQADVDSDMIGDVCDSDNDNDGLSDVDESTLYGTNPFDADSDDDGLNDGDEINTYLTNPLESDSDDDGVNDGDEVAAGTDPNVPDLNVPFIWLSGYSFLAALLIGITLRVRRRSKL